MPNFMKIRPVGAELFHADGKTDMTRLTVAFRNANAQKKKYFRTEVTVKKRRHTVSSRSTIFYPTTRIATSFTPFAGWQASPRSPPFQYTVSLGPCLLLKRTAVNISIIPTVSEDGNVNAFLRFADTRHF
jgi:hypothetical protein